MSTDWYGGVILLFVPVRYCPLPSAHGEKQLDSALHMVQCCFINASRNLQFLVFEIIILQSVWHDSPVKGFLIGCVKHGELFHVGGTGDLVRVFLCPGECGQKHGGKDSDVPHKHNRVRIA